MTSYEDLKAAAAADELTLTPRCGDGGELPIPRDGGRRLRPATAAGLPVAAAWIALTAATGKTYHLAPLVAAAAPGVVARMVGIDARGLVVAGIAAVLMGWLAIVGLGIEPPFTLWRGQPGGVRGEVAAFAAFGAVIGAGRGPMWLARRVLRPRR